MSRHLGKGRISDDIRDRMRARERELVLEDIESIDEQVDVERIDDIMRRIKLPGISKRDFSDAVKRLQHAQSVHGQTRAPRFSWSTGSNTANLMEVRDSKDAVRWHTS